MRIEISGKGVADAALRTHGERRLRFALARFQSKLSRVVLRIADLNGPRGGVDKQATVRAVVEPSQNIIVVQRHDDPYAAVALAAERAGLAVARAIHRQHDRRYVRTGARGR